MDDQPDLYDTELRAALTANDAGIVGSMAPKVERVFEPDIDPWYWKRKKAAAKLGVDIDDLEMEPDNLAESPEQNWDEDWHHEIRHLG